MNRGIIIGGIIGIGLLSYLFYEKYNNNRVVNSNTTSTNTNNLPIGADNLQGLVSTINSIPINKNGSVTINGSNLSTEQIAAINAQNTQQQTAMNNPNINYYAQFGGYNAYKAVQAGYTGAIANGLTWVHNGITYNL